ncbi:MAG: NAD+ synthase [Rhodospirillales bacterium]|nr:MAG: NAD+ synthase [Rhodospirillales bacterium]
MTDSLALALAQINPIVGDIDGNVERVRTARAAAADADLMIGGELVLAGYPPEDLVLKRSFQDRIEAAVDALARDTGDGGPALLIGAPWRRGGRLYNAALLLEGGRVAGAVLKHELPNYGVFDEIRVFAPGPLPEPMPFRGARLGVMVCEDMWKPPVSRHLHERGAEILVVINGSPFDLEKWGVRRRMAQQRVSELGLPLIYVNLVGGQDELVFDGASFVLAPDGGFCLQAPEWCAGVVPTRWRRGEAGWACDAGVIAPRTEGLEAIYHAMVVGLRDYVGKNSFPGVVIGLSGGIDSALTAAVAVDALGPERVRCLMMPSPYTSRISLDDAAQVAERLGVQLDTVDITPAMAAFDTMLTDLFSGLEPDTTEENVQARARAIVLMAVSNKFGHMLLTTGNKSEMSVGYATLYGDMSGGFSVLKDVYKTTVFALSRWRNQTRPDGMLGPTGTVIPERIITRPPSAELKADQTDQDSLPPYEELDAILHCLIEEDRSIADVVAAGFDAATVRRVWQMLDRAEYKRRQAPPGVKITDRAFGRDRRYPITNRFINGL